MRYLWVDQARLVGAFAVVSIHACSGLYASFGVADSSSWWFANFVITIGKSVANPIFAMLSGYLMLGRDTDTLSFIKVHTRRFIPVLVFWSIFYAVFSFLFFSSSLLDFFWRLSVGFLLTGQSYFHLWYLSMFICMLLFAPFINQWICGSRPTSRDIKILLVIIAFIISMNALSNVKREITGNGIEWYTNFAWYLSYFIMGYFIGRGRIAKHISVYWFVAAFTIVFFVCFTGNYIAATHGVIKDSLIVANNGIFGFIMAISAFCIFTRINLGKLTGKRLHILASTAFGIYLIHPAVLYFAENFSRLFINNKILGTIFSILVTFFGSSLLVYLIRRTRVGYSLT